jgi:hypothetical protein
MAKNIGILKFSGLIDDLVHYKRNGVYVVQRKGGFDGERTKNEARYEGTRQCQTEFGKCASLASAFKRCLQEYLNTIPDTVIYNWIQSKILALKACDMESERGQKTVLKGIQTASGTQLLHQLHFNRLQKIDTLLLATLEMQMETGVLTLSSSNLPIQINGTKDSCRLQLLMVRMNFETYQYELAASSFYYFDAVPTDVIVLTSPIPKGEGVLLAFLYVGFYTLSQSTPVWLRHRHTALDLVGFLQ